MGIEWEIEGSLPSDTVTKIRCPTVFAPISHPQFCDREIPHRVSLTSSMIQPLADKSRLIIMNSPFHEHNSLPAENIGQV
jgi:hypothetical protein